MGTTTFLVTNDRAGSRRNTFLIVEFRFLPTLTIAYARRRKSLVLRNDLPTLDLPLCLNEHMKFFQFSREIARMSTSIIVRRINELGQ